MNGIDLLGVVLLQFLWQGFLIAAVYAGARRYVARPEVRYGLGCGALFAMMASPLATWVFLRPMTPDAIALTSLSVRNSAPAGWGFPGELSGLLAARYDQAPSMWLSLIATAWMAGVVVFCLRLIGGWMLVGGLRRRKIQTVPSAWLQKFDDLRAQLRMARPVRLLVSGLVETPSVVGLLRPVVLVPVGALAGLPPEQMEALLLHELAHIRRFDYLVNGLQSVVEALLFYHPAVWWISGQIRSERELCCDDAVVEVTGDVESYVRALANVGAPSLAHNHAAVAASGGSLANRVARLLGEPRPASRRYSPAAVAAVLTAATVAMVVGQTARPQVHAFDAVSIRRYFGPLISPDDWRLAPNGYHAHGVPLVLVLMSAYVPSQQSGVATFNVEDFVGLPDWMLHASYDVDAKVANEDVAAWKEPAVQQAMLQAMLEDRLKLAVHRETKVVASYELHVAKGGVKFRPAETPDVSAMQEQHAGAGAVPGGTVIFNGPGPGEYSMHNVNMATLGKILCRMAGRPIVDKTGLTGRYDITLRKEPSGVDSVDTVFSDIEQLGLKLEPAKSPVESLVIDHAERPSAN